MIRLCDYLTPDLVKLPLAAHTKSAAIEELVDLVAAAGRTHARDRLLACVLAREAQRSTAVGKGLAIPHAKCDATGEMVVALGVPAAPLPFDAIDGQPVRLIALLASPLAQASLQIQLLARLSRLALASQVFDQITAAPTPADLLAVIRANDG
ncbi:MAG: PTS sugar transporter subunit IIA [Phycisphaerae bacterium]